jgi:hypothetical protein
MRKFLCPLGLLLVLFAACGSSTPSPVVERKIPEDFLGLVHAGIKESSQEYDLIDEMGAAWILNTFYWSRIEGAKGGWDWAGCDGYVNKAAARGKKILAVLAYDTPWIHDPSQALSELPAGTELKHTDKKAHDYVQAEQIPLYCNFVKETVTRYKGRVGAWCIWNEPNLSDRFWSGTRVEFYALSKAAAEAIREADPNAVILGGAFNTTASEEWITGLFSSGAMKKVDFAAYHPYIGDGEGSAILFKSFRDLAARYGFGEKVWVTEVGYTTTTASFWDYPIKVPEERMPEEVVKTITLLAAEGAQRVFWYQLFDPPYQNKDPLEPEDNFGLLEDDYTPKKGKEAYALCGRLIPGSTWKEALPERSGLPDTVRAFYFEGAPGKPNVLILWNYSAAAVQAELSLPGGNRQIWNIETGAPQPAAEEKFPLSLGSLPLVYTWEPLAGGGPPRLSAPGQ